MSDYRTLAEDALALLATGQPGHEAERVRDVIAFLRAGLPPTFDKVAHVKAQSGQLPLMRQLVSDAVAKYRNDAAYWKLCIRPSTRPDLVAMYTADSASCAANADALQAELAELDRAPAEPVGAVGLTDAQCFEIVSALEDKKHLVLYSGRAERRDVIHTIQSAALRGAK